MADDSAKPKKSKIERGIARRAKKKPPTGLVVKPRAIQNRFIFRDQLSANGYDLVGEVIKNINMLEDPKDRLLYQMRLMEYAYNKLDIVQIIQPLDPSRQGGEGVRSSPANTIDAEFTSNKEETFNDMIRRI